MKATFTFDGGKELLAALEQLSDRVARKIQRDALEEAAEPMRKRMEQLAPHAAGTPDLRDKMVIRRATGEDTNEIAVAIGPTKSGFYGSFQEFGTSRHPAQPFARPAFDTETERVLRILSDVLWREMAGKGGVRSTGGGGPVTGGSGGGGLL